MATRNARAVTRCLCRVSAAAWVTLPYTDAISELLVTVLGIVRTRVDPSVQRAALYPGGAVAWDDCCDGQLWVRLIGVQPSGTPAKGTLQPCGVPMWQVTLGVGILRCVATLDDSGGAPSEEELSRDTLQGVADMATLRQALQCEVSPRVEQPVISRWAPLGPLGGCAGGEWTFSARVYSCACEV